MGYVGNTKVPTYIEMEKPWCTRGLSSREAWVQIPTRTPEFLPQALEKKKHYEEIKILVN